MKVPFLLGRAILGGFFVYNGVNHFRHLPYMAQYAEAKNVPMPKVGVAVAGALLVAGGSSIILGIKPRFGVAAIITFLAAVTPVMHDFWRVEDPQKQGEMINFSKNIALLGAALALAGIEEPWPASLEVARPAPARRILHAVRRMAA